MILLVQLITTRKKKNWRKLCVEQVWHSMRAKINSCGAVPQLINVTALICYRKEFAYMNAIVYMVTAIENEINCNPLSVHMAYTRSCQKFSIFLKSRSSLYIYVCIKELPTDEVKFVCKWIVYVCVNMWNTLYADLLSGILRIEKHAEEACAMHDWDSSSWCIM